MSKQSGPRMTLPTQLVLRALLAEPTQEMYGLQICQAAGLPSGTIHPILARLERARMAGVPMGRRQPSGRGPTQASVLQAD